MSRVLTARHPVPVRMFTKGGRRECLAFRAETTPVEFRDVPVAAMRAYAPGAAGEGVAAMDAALGERQPPLWEAEGRLWTRAFRTGREVGPGAHERIPLSRDDLAGAVGAPSARDDGTSLERLFERSPLRAWHGTGAAERGWPRAHLGASAPLEGRVVEDHGDEARHALHRFVADMVRVVGDQVFVAFEGTHRVVMPPGDPDRRRFARSTTTSPRHFVCHHATRGFLLRADRASFTVGPPDPTGMAVEMPLLGNGAALGDDDVAAHLNDLPGRCATALARSPRVAREVDADPLLRWVALGSIGAITAEDARDALDAVESVADEAWMVARAVEAPAGFLGMALAYVRNVAGPVLAAPGAAMAPGDSAALLGLG